MLELLESLNFSQTFKEHFVRNAHLMDCEKLYRQIRFSGHESEGGKMALEVCGSKVGPMVGKTGGNITQAAPPPGPGPLRARTKTSCGRIMEREAFSGC